MSDSVRRAVTPEQAIAELYRRVRDLELRLTGAGGHDHDADYSDVAHNHDALYSLLAHDHLVLPKGAIAYHRPTADVNVTSGAQVATVTPTLIANRRYKISAGITLADSAGGSDTAVYIRTNTSLLAGNGTLERTTYGSGTGVYNFYRTYIDVGSGAGAKNFNLYAQRVLGTGTITAVYGGGAYLNFVLVEDMGPA